MSYNPYDDIEIYVLMNNSSDLFVNSNKITFIKRGYDRKFTFECNGNKFYDLKDLFEKCIKNSF